MGSRTWIKVYCDRWLEGTLRGESPDVRAVWIDLLTLAGGGRYGDSGEIKLTNGVGYSDKQICEILAIKRGVWKRAKQRLVETDRIKISPRGAISIVNWSKYQSEYERQKRYRQPETEDSMSEPESPLRIPPESEKENESEKLQRDVTTESDTPNTRSPLLNGRLTPPLASQDKTTTTRLAECLRGRGVSTPSQLSEALGIPVQTVRVYLSQSKKRGLVSNPQRGKWDTKCAPKEGQNG